MSNPYVGSGVLAVRVYEHCLTHSESFTSLPHIAYLMGALLKGSYVELDEGVEDDATFLNILREDGELFHSLLEVGAIKPVSDE